MVPDTRAKLMLSDKVLRLVPDMEIARSDFLRLVLQSNIVRRQIATSLSGSTGQANISQEAVRAIRIPLPSVAEQKRIVAVLEALDEQEGAIEAAIAKARLIRREVARGLLSCPGVAVAAVGDVAVVASGSTPSRSRPDYWTGGDVPWVRTAEISFDAISGTAECITRKAIEETGLRVYKPGTVLLAMYGEGVTRGRSAILGIHATINQAAAAIVCDPKRIDHRYLYYWLEGNYEEIRKIGQGSNQTNLNSALVAAIRLPLPSIEDQRRLVAPIEAVGVKVKTDVQELEKLRTIRRGVVDGLLSGSRRGRAA
jgi:type I restriction enzyme S subunit